ncbi:MAG: hypothetical protein M0R46_16710 [Candidatus Muirbacterium halophilum]|nr:hypothetical protein [Candidatus Muirbacterium halophilum]
MSNRYNSLIRAIKEIDTDNIKELDDDSPELITTSKIIEKQKVYLWIRLYLKTEININIGDVVTLTYTPSGEKLDTIFSSYGKKGNNENHDNEIIDYDPEDDKKILCLMIDEDTIKDNSDIPFIRTLFKNSKHYEYQLVKRDELIFKSGEMIINYYDVDY